MAQIVRILTDQTNYCRYDPACDTVTAICQLRNVAAGDSVTVQLVRLDGYGPVLAASSGPLAANQPWARVPLPLARCVDQRPTPIYRARAGRYAVQDASNPQTASAPLTVTLVSLRRFREEICKGLPLTTTETVWPLDAFRQITGVVVTSVKPETYPDVYPFAFDPVAGTLSWAGGPPAPVLQGGEVRLIDGTGRFWLTVRVDPSLLPAAPVTESVAFDERRMDDAALVAEIATAQAEIEDRLVTYLEPTEVATRIMQEYLRANPQAYPQATPWADVLLPPVNFPRAEMQHNWIGFSLPARSLLALDALGGFLNDTLVLQLDPGWWQWSERNGLIQLVPRAGAAVAWFAYNVFAYQFLVGAYDYVPDFWHYKATVGLRDLWERRAVVRQAVEYAAAVKVLRQAALHAKPGYTGESLARDGVSQSISYGAGPGGIYAQTIQAYEAWLQQWLPRLRDHVAGLTVRLI